MDATTDTYFTESSLLNYLQNADADPSQIFTDSMSVLYATLGKGNNAAGLTASAMVSLAMYSPAQAAMHMWCTGFLMGVEMERRRVELKAMEEWVK